MNVPKFASFRSRPDTALKPDPPPKEEKPKRHRGHDARDHPRSERRARSRSKERKHSTHADTLPQREAPRVEVFVVDRKGDEKNLIYGEVHRYSVPPFFRIGKGGVLGVPRRFTIQRELSDEKGIFLSDLRETRAFKREKYVFSKMQKPRLLKIRPTAFIEEDSSLQTDFMFLELPRGLKRRRDGDKGSDSSGSENESKDYRSIHGKAKSDQPADAAFQFASESDQSDSGEAMDDSASARKKNAELNRKVERSPHDIEAWIALIAHQDILLQGDDDQRRITNAELRSTADIKIHMYEKALEQAKCLADRERLLQGIMAEGAKIWEVKNQAERWEQISRDNIDSLLLWKSYLNFRQTTFSTFRYEEVRELYADRLKRLVKEITLCAVERVDSLYKQLIYVLLRFTLFLRESGYTELSVAIWQANLEVNFRSPAHKDLKRDFRLFWESEVGRFGEDGSLGWEHFYRNADDAEATPVQTDEQEKFVGVDKLFHKWAKAEHLRQITSHHPAKTMDETVEDDPFRVILFTDIEDFLFPLPTTSGNLQKLFVHAFLQFCRLPAIGYKNKNWEHDAFIDGAILEADTSWIETQFATSSHEYLESPILSALKTPSMNFAGSPDTLFNKHWYQSVRPWNEVYGSYEHGPVSYTWVRNTLKQILAAQFSDDLAEYLLAFEWRNEAGSIKKTAKGLIKSQSDSLRLYNAYAMVEWSRDNREIGANVFTAALNMSLSMPEEKRVEAILLWKNWIWVCLEDGDHALALKHILSIADGTPNPSTEISPTALIRAKQHLTSNRDYLLTSGDIHHSAIYTECLFLLAYLSPQTPHQGDITTALSHIETFSQTLTSRNLTKSTPHELLLQSATRLLFHHARTGPFRPALLRFQLFTYLTIFPHNTILLSLYSWNESRFKIEGRVRKLLLSTESQNHNHSPLFKIKWEIENGTIHSAHSAFENTLSSSTSEYKSSAALWRLYLLFTIRHFKGKAKDVWYRGLRACPWAKELYVTGFEMLEEKEVGFEELRGTWRVMGEKELRVHVDLEEEFEDLGEN